MLRRSADAVVGAAAGAAAGAGRSMILALDPGPQRTGWCIFGAGKVHDAGVADNHDVLRWVQAGQGCDMLAIEMIANMGMAVGKTTFDTVRWVGRYQQAWRDPESVKLVLRTEVKMHVCGNSRARDPNIRQSLIDTLGAPGTKKAPGPTHGVTSHAWSALAVAVTAAALSACGGGDPEEERASVDPVQCEQRAGACR